MKTKSILTTIALAVTLAPQTVFGAGCDGILSLTRSVNLDVRSASNAKFIHEQYCDQGALKAGKSFALGLDIAVKNVPVKLNLGSGSTEERVNHICKTYDDWAASSSDTLGLIETTKDRAIEAWERCVTLENDVVNFSVVPGVGQIAFGVERGRDNIRFNGLVYDPELLTCKGAFGDNGSLIDMDDFPGITLDRSKSYSMSCVRTRDVLEDGTIRYPFSEVTLLAEGGQLVVPLAEENILPRSISSDLQADIADLQGRLGSLQEELAKLKTELVDFESSPESHSGLSFMFNGTDWVKARFEGFENPSNIPQFPRYSGDSICPQGTYAIGVESWGHAAKELYGSMLGIRLRCKEFPVK